MSQIAARKNEIQENRERKRDNALMFAMFGYPQVGMASLLMATNDDSRIQKLTRELETAKAGRSRVRAQIVAHQATKEILQVRLGRLQSNEAGLVANLDPESPEVPRKLGALAKAEAAVSQRRRLVRNLKSQVEVLGSMRDSARGVNSALSGLAASLGQQVKVAEKLLQASNRDLDKMLRIMLAKDPDAAAVRYVRGQVRAVVKKAVTQMVARNWRARGTVAKELRKEFVARLMVSLGA